MKKIIAVILVMAILMPCALAGDVTLFRWEQGMSYQVQSVAYAGGTVYMFMREDMYYSWTEETGLVEHKMALPDNSEENAWTQPMAYAADGESLKAVTVKVQYDPDNGTGHVAGAYLTTLVADEKGDLSYGDSVKLDWKDMIEYYGEDEGSREVRGAFIQDGKLMFTTYGDRGSLFMCYDVETGEGGQLDVEVEGDVYAICPYKDGALLAFVLDYQNVEKGMQVYAVNGDGASPLGLIPIKDWNTPSSPAYDPRTDTLCYVLDGEVMRVEGMDFENAQAVNSAPSRGADLACCITDDGRYLAANYDSVTLMNIDPEKRAQTRLTVMYSYNNAVESGSIEFENKHPEVEVRLINSVGDLVQAMMSQDASVDVYLADADTAAYAALMERGYLTDLSGSKVISELVGEMYPWLSQAAMKDGKVYALPLRLNVDVPFSWNTEAAKKLGAEDEMPTTWVEFFELLRDRGPELADNHKISIFEPYFVVKRAREYLFAAMLNDYLLYLGTLEPMQRSFDTQEMHEMMRAFESVDFGNLGLAEEEQDGYSWDGDSVLIQTYGSISPQYYGGDSMVNMLLSVGEGIEAKAEGRVTMLFVNPYSKNRDLAIEMVEMIAGKMDDVNRIAMCPGENEPIKSPYAEENLKNIDEYIESLKKSMEETEDEDEKAGYQEQLDEMLEDRQKYVDEYSWDVSAKNIERYRAEADQIQVAGYLGIDLNSESSEQMQNLIQQYLDGAVDGQGFLRQLDQMYRMMMMEGM